jgi:hypothetical protein
MTKRKPKSDDDLVTGLACLLAHLKFNPADGALIMDSLGAICASVTRSADLEERVEKLEREIKAARAKKAPIVKLREAG